MHISSHFSGFEQVQSLVDNLPEDLQYLELNGLIYPLDDSFLSFCLRKIQCFVVTNAPDLSQDRILELANKFESHITAFNSKVNFPLDLVDLRPFAKKQLAPGQTNVLPRRTRDDEIKFRAVVLREGRNQVILLTRKSRA